MKKIILSLGIMGLTFSNFAQTALNFDGTNDQVACGSGINISNASFTFEMWAQSTPNGAHQHLFSMGNSATNQGLHTRLEASGNVYFGFWGNDLSSGPQASTTDGQWHHYAFSYNHLTNSRKIYVDGIQIAANTASADYSGTGVLNIGVRDMVGVSPLENFNGNIDQFRVWDHERSSTEINDNMGICLTGSETGLLALYDFEDGTGSSSLTDLTGNGNTGTLTNMDPSTDWVSGYACSGCSIAEQTINEADFSICSAGDNTINLNGSEAGISYFLRDDADDSILDGPIAGTGSGISFTTGTLSATTTMNVYAQSTASLSDGLDFDGSNDQAVGSDTGFPTGASNRTLETWIKITTPPDGHEMAIMYGSPFAQQYCGIGVHPSGRAFFWGFSADLQGTTIITDGNWHHVAATYDGTTMKIYVDGVHENSQNFTLNTVLDGDFQLGFETGSPLGGAIDKVSIWDYTKSDAEIAEAVNKCYTGSETGLVALWNLDDGTGSSIATDATGNGHDATLTNMDPSTDWVSGSSCFDCDLEMADMITITVGDNTAPVPDVATLSDVTAECSVTALTAPTANDNCAGAITGTHNATLPITTQGTTTVTWTYDDGNGNTSTQTQDVVIDDVTAPVPDVATLSDVTAECSVTALTAPTANDNCAGAITGTHNATLPITAQGTTTVTWTYDDGNGNTSTQTQDVVIDDVTAPVPDVATLSDVTAECSVTALTAPTANDNCAGAITGTHNATLPITAQGTTTVTWTYDDGNGNTTTQTQDVVIDDVTAPVADVATLSDVTAECSVTALTAPTANDNCAGAITGTHNATLPITAQGTTTVTWTYDDGNGNTTTQTQDVVIDDVTAPVPDVATLSDVTAECEVTALTAPTANDNCAGAITGTHNATLPITTQGTTTVTWTYDDGNGNTTTQTQDVVIDDVTAPVISNCPTDMTVNVNSTSCSALVSWTPPNAVDNCTSTLMMTNSHNPGDSFGLGTTTVNYIYTDDASNNATCTFDVTVTSDLNVVVDNAIDATCYSFADGEINVTTSGGSTPYQFDWDNDGTGDNDDSEDATGLIAGSYNLTVTDAFGCTVSTSATVNEPTELIVATVTTTNPSSCGTNDGSFDVSVSGGTLPYTYDWDNDGTGDNDDIEDLSGLPAGTYNLIVTDANGCNAFHSIGLSDPAGPTITTDAIVNNNCFEDANGSIDVTISGGTGTLLIDWDNDGTGDNDDTEDLSALAAGTYNLTVTDDNGCIATTSETITEPAEILVPQAFTICSNDSIFLAGAYQNTAGIYFDTLSTVVFGCDSIIQTTLSVNPAIENILPAITICAGDSVDVFGTYQMTAGFYYDTLATTLSCDSVVIQEIIINTVDNSTSINGFDIEANAAGTGITYQWLDCSDNSALSGETNQTFTATLNGEYAVEINDNGCIDTSACQLIEGIGFSENELVFEVYPNPNQGLFIVKADPQYLGGQIVIQTIDGKIIRKEIILETSTQIDLQNEERGSYILTVTTNENTAVKRIVIH